MLTATVSTTDPDTGKPLAVSPEHLRRAERVSHLLQETLADVSTKFPVNIRLQFRGSGERPALELDLLTERDGARPGVEDVPLALESLGADDDIRRALRGPVWRFSNVLSDLVDLELASIRRNLEAILNDE